ncbi:MAG: DUF4249 domain-containing protein [Bacteroidota bacterium]|nr:DUF4249 domain-containing protein [Bacteroidota bacterium]
MKTTRINNIHTIARKSSILIILFQAMFIFSCEKVITVDLSKTDPQIVIEGVVTDQPGTYSVMLSKTRSYFESSASFQPVPNAFITVFDNLGNIDTLKETISGTYVSSTLQGIAGRTYTLKVDAEGKRYNAVSSMPRKVFIDSLYAVPKKFFGDKNGYDVYILFKDPPEMGNYYRLIAQVNSMPMDSLTYGPTYFLHNDKLTNGNQIEEHIGIQKNVHPGDTLTVKLLSIDKAAFDYYKTLIDIISMMPTSISPANPNTNLSNGALGYFAAYTIDTKQIILK